MFRGKRPGPLLCFTFNLKNAIKKAFPSFNHKSESKKKGNSRIECLMDFLAFDINQLLIYENQKKKSKKPALIHQLRIMKMKVDEVKAISCDSKCLSRAEEMLKRRSHLKCTSRSFRKELIEFMANVEHTDKRSKIVCEIMRQLDSTDLDIAGLCKSVKEMPKALNCDIQTAADFARTDEKRLDCGDVKALCPSICEEVMRPYDPATDEDADSIHLRYVPALDSFKANMARNPCALRLPLMCPPMKRIMNKMKSSYLMDDVPCKLQKDEAQAKLNWSPIVNYIKVIQNFTDVRQKHRERKYSY
ncbi:hypothetical protein GE061_014768 [Apolygus lucorum]|uniref:Uncharacterized protein n=1 Tax=Apolygus lucorum TaxID=248454 RepID=A0A8S9XN62_APOLU|nr:hypothetical protein GE061_014768 [Apolygus lucorum]